MESRYITSADLQIVAEALQDLKNQMVFVGGAVVGLYADGAITEELRPTHDIDLTITLMSFRNWYAIQEQLAIYGFHPDPFGRAICSYKCQDIPVDIMPAEDGPLGPANTWYASGFDDLWTSQVNGTEIQEFLKDECQKILDHPTSTEVLSVHIPPLLLDELLPLLEDKVHRIASLA